MMAKRRQCSLKSKILLGVVVLAAIVGFGAVAYAAPLGSSENPRPDRPGLFDPFTLSRIAYAGEEGSRADDVSGRLNVEITVKHVAKQIWVPLRPGLRSPIRPPITS
jgi:hypothetical protein